MHFPSPKQLLHAMACYEKLILHLHLPQVSGLSDQKQLYLSCSKAVNPKIQNKNMTYIHNINK